MAMTEADARRDMQVLKRRLDDARAHGEPNNVIDGIVIGMFQLFNDATRIPLDPGVCNELHDLAVAEARKQMQAHMREFDEAFARGASSHDLRGIIHYVHTLIQQARYYGVNPAICDELDVIRLDAELKVAEREGEKHVIKDVRDQAARLNSTDLINELAAIAWDAHFSLAELEKEKEWVEATIDRMKIWLGKPLDPHIKNKAQAIRFAAELFIDLINLNESNMRLRDFLKQETDLKVQIAKETDPGRLDNLQRQLADLQQRELSPAQAEQQRLYEEFRTALTEAEKHCESCPDRAVKQRLGDRILRIKLYAAIDDLCLADEAILGTLQQIAASRAKIAAATLTHGDEALRQQQLQAHQSLLVLLKTQKATRQRHCNTIDQLTLEVSADSSAATREAAQNARADIFYGEQIHRLQENTAEIDFCHRKFELLLPSVETAATRVEQLQAKITRTVPVGEDPPESLQKALEEAQEKLRVLSHMAEELLAQLRMLRGREEEIYYGRIRSKYDRRDIDYHSRMLTNEQDIWNDLCDRHPASMRAIDTTAQTRAERAARALWGNIKADADPFQYIEDDDGLYRDYIDILRVLRPGANENRTKETIARNLQSILFDINHYTSITERKIRAEYMAFHLFYTTRSPAEIARNDDLYRRYEGMLAVLRPGVIAERDEDKITHNMTSILGAKQKHRGELGLENWCAGEFIERKSKETLTMEEARAVARQRRRDSHGAVTRTVVGVGEKFYVATLSVTTRGNVNCDLRSLVEYVNDQLSKLSLHGTTLEDREILDDIALVLRSAEQQAGYKGSKVEERVNVSIRKRFMELGIDCPTTGDPTHGPVANLVDVMGTPVSGGAAPVVLSANVAFSRLRRMLVAQCYRENEGDYAESKADKAAIGDSGKIAAEKKKRTQDKATVRLAVTHVDEQYKKGEVSTDTREAALVDALEFRSYDRIDEYTVIDRKATAEKPAAIILEKGTGENKATITFEPTADGLRTQAEVRSKNRDVEIEAAVDAAEHLIAAATTTPDHNKAASVDLSSVKSDAFFDLFGTEKTKVQAEYLQGFLDRKIVPVLEPYASRNADTAVWNTYKELLKMDKKIGGGSNLAEQYLNLVLDGSNEKLKESLIDAMLAETGEVSEGQTKIRYVRDDLYTKDELMDGQDADRNPIIVADVIHAQAEKSSKDIKRDRSFIAPKGDSTDMSVSGDDYQGSPSPR